MSRPLRALRELGASFAGAEVLVLCHHEVRSRERFRAQMSILVERGYSVLTMDHLVAWLRRGRPIPSRTAVLTFDGGYRSQLDNAVPTLETMRLSATFFPLSAGLDDAEISGRDLAALAARGHTIGCHSHTHPDLTTLSPDDLEREVAGSRQILEHAVGRPPSTAQASRSPSRSTSAASTPATIPTSSDASRSSASRGPVQFAAFLRGTRFIAGSILIGWKIRERFLDRALARSEPGQARPT
jgi:peptidoglycan/xylan/chitin deacetylase (PgdA/CDA1 family)